MFLNAKEREVFSRYEFEREIHDVLARPVPTTATGMDAITMGWLCEWQRERRLLLKLLGRAGWWDSERP